MVNHVNLLLKFFTTLQAELQLRSRGHPGKDYACDRLMLRARKRALIPNKSLEAATFEAFYELNASLDGYKNSLDAGVRHRASLFIQQTLEGYTKQLDPDGVQEVLHLPEIFDQWRFGPGTSNGVKGTHVAEKLGQRMTCTFDSRPYVVHLRELSHYFRAFDGRKGAGTSLVYGSKLAVVPKNETTMRTIAIEPSGNMVLQLAAGRYIENALKRIGLDISTQQPKNKALARVASLDGSLATIDLKSASDMITPDLVRALWPDEWYRLFDSLRSPLISIPGRGEPVSLNMMSTMGNGFTFPMMTLTLLALVMANRNQNLRRVDWQKTAVFGDDIIVPSHEYAGLCEVLESAGLVVNHDKSYCDGPFRESCGGDYYEGYDVTPFYVKTLRDEASTYTAINQLLDWCGRHNVFLPRSLSLLVDSLKVRPSFVPEWMGPESGIQTSLVAAQYKYLRPKPVRVRLRDDRYAMMLACGGYLISGNKDDQMFYMPRVNNPQYEVKKGRLPKGYLSGWDPCKRSQLTSDHVVQHLRLIG